MVDVDALTPGTHLVTENQFCCLTDGTRETILLLESAILLFTGRGARYLHFTVLSAHTVQKQLEGTNIKVLPILIPQFTRILPTEVIQGVLP